MENASKALLMAAGVLIGILIISLAVYLFVSFGSTSAEIHKQNEEQQIEQFNSQFTSYEGKKCTIYDVVTIANLATENNKYYDFEKRNYKTNGNDNYISVKVSNYQELRLNQFMEGEDEYNKAIQNSLENPSITYRCKVSISTKTQRVFYVEFMKENQ